ncbi:hypothetical protein K502DRAFT_329896 [Neoconidiobolus thromboides FSU 785]|nr:hypothetical protein K502DRAFT_329896 [Neoconidiobolus thromboides FSU 785]
MEESANFKTISDIIKNQFKASGYLKQIESFSDSPNNFTKNINEEDSIDLNLPHYWQFTQNLLKKDWNELTPWFDLYKESFFNTNRVVDHETFDHPIACINAVAAHNANPIEAMKKLYDQNNQLDKLSFVDPERVQCFILVHDARLGNFEKTQEIYTQLKKNHGNNCYLLVINSRPPTSDFSEVEPNVEDIWSKTKLNLSTSNYNNTGSCGQYLSIDDVESIQNLIKKIVIEVVLPAMERKMHFLNEQVASSRRGFTGRLFSASRRYFGTNKSLSPTSSSTGGSGQTSPNLGLGSPTFTQYQHTSSEAQLRKLADIAFMLRDYEFSRNTYETVKKDFQADNSWRFYASAQEMIGLCLLFSEVSGARLDVERYYDKPIHYYLSLKMPVWASRCALLYHAMFKYHHRYRDIPLLLVRLTGEDSDIQSALFLEQAAFGYLKTQPNRIRKFAFHLILAGHNFNKCNQREHAYRCYKIASKIFCNKEEIINNDSNNKLKKWNLIEDHINFSLGRQSLHLGELKQAIIYFSSLLMDSNHSNIIQAGYMKELIYIYKSYLSSTNHELLLEKDYSLSIPEIDLNTINIQYNIKDEEIESMTNNDLTSFNKMEKEAIINFKKSNVSNGIIMEHTSKYDQFQSFCVDESFLIQITVYNPLKIPINLSNIQLDYIYPDDSCKEGLEIFTSEEVTIEPLTSVIVTLNIHPKREGLISINGIYYTLNQVILLYKSFYQKGKRLNTTVIQRKGNHYDEDKKFKIFITKRLPKLEIEFLEIPEAILSGEIINKKLKVKNVGFEKLDILKVKCSNPTFFTFGNTKENEYQLQHSEWIDNNIQDLSELNIITENEEGILPNQEIEIPLFIRGDRIGNHKFNFLFKYGVKNMKELSIECRILKKNISFIVQPSLKINAFTRPSSKNLDSFLLGIEVENVQAFNSFTINQITSISNHWQILKLDNNEDRQIIENMIQPRQSTFIYYLITRIENQNEIDNLDSPENQMATSLQALTLGLKQFDLYNDLKLNFTNLNMNIEYRI